MSATASPGPILERPSPRDFDDLSRLSARRTELDVAPESPSIQYLFSARELLLAVRPHQWIKNALVLLASIASGAILHPAGLVAAVIATVAFCAASAATYLMNDLADVDADKLHPTKQLRPIAAGTLSVADAQTTTVILGGLAFGLAAGLGAVFVAVLLGYLAMTTAYSKILKHIPFVDVVTVAAGFVLRVVAGGIAVSVGVSVWLLAAVAAAAMLISLGKRHAEVGRLGVDAGGHRAVLDWYIPVRTRTLMIATHAIAVAAVGIWFAISFALALAFAGTVIVALILERFRRLVLAGEVDDPVRVVSHDRPIAAASLVLGAGMLAGVLL